MATRTFVYTKIMVCMLLIFVQQPQHASVLSVDQVLAWRTYYGLPLDKDVSEAISIFGQPNETAPSKRKWNPSSRTGLRAVFAELGPTPTQGPRTVLRLTVFSHPSDVLPVNELLHTPEKFIFDSEKNKEGTYFSAETKDHGMKILYLCSPDHDPQFQAVIIRSVKSPDTEL